MILAYRNADFEGPKGFLPKNYQSDNPFWQGDPLWPDTIYHQKPGQSQKNFHCHSSPVQTQTAPTSTNLTPATFPLQNVWVKIKPSVGYTAGPVAGVSANEKARLWQGQNYNRKLSFALSNASDTAVPSRLPQTSARLTPERLRDCWKRPANERRISIDYSWKNSNNRLKQSSWMNYTAELPKGQKRGKTQKAKASSKRPCVGSYGAGSSKSFCDRFASWPPQLGNCLSIDHIGSCVLYEEIAFASYRRAFAVSCGYSASLWPDKASPQTQERSWPETQAIPQTTAELAGWCGQEDSKFQRQTAGSYYLCSFWPTQRYRASYSAIEDWQADKYFSSGEAQRYIERSADKIGQTDPEWFPTELCVAMVVVALAGFVQLGACSWLSEWADAGDVRRSCTKCVDGIEIYSLPCSCQRPDAPSLGRAARKSSGVTIRCLST